MAVFADLSTELAQYILTHLDPADLYAVSLASTSFHALAEPILYQEIEWVWDEKDRPGPSVDLLLRSCLRRPELSSFIKCIAFKGTKINQSSIESNFSDDDLRLALQIMPRIDLGKVSKDGGAVYVSIAVALLISQLTNLESLHLDNPSLAAQPAFIELLESIFYHDTAIGFQSLQHFLFLKRRLRTKRFSALFYLPCIQSITISLSEPHDLMLWPGQRPCASTLTKLDLQWTTLKEESLTDILSATPNLKILTYDFYCDADPAIPGESTYLKCEKLAAALHQVVATLESLTISISFYASTAMEVDSGSEWGIQGSLGSLRDFSHLRYLEVPVTVLLGWSAEASVTQKLGEILPRNLRHLYLKDDLWYFDEYAWDSKLYLAQFEDFLHDGKSNTPNLDAIALNLIREEADGKEENLNRIVVLCEAADIKCTFDT